MNDILKIFYPKNYLYRRECDCAVAELLRTLTIRN